MSANYHEKKMETASQNQTQNKTFVCVCCMCCMCQYVFVPFPVHNGQKDIYENQNMHNRT